MPFLRAQMATPMLAVIATPEVPRESISAVPIFAMSMIVNKECPVYISVREAPPPPTKTPAVVRCRNEI